MKILIITTSDIEFEGLHRSFLFHRGRAEKTGSLSMANLSITFINGGPGIYNMCYSLTRALGERNWDLVLNAGICGSYIQEIQPGAVVRVRKDAFADTGKLNQGRFADLGGMGLVNPNEYPFENGLIRDDYGWRLKTLEGIREVQGLTLNRLPVDPEVFEFWKGRSSPEVESMEGAAFLFVARKEKIPCLQIRAVSNMVKEVDPSKWMVTEALANLGKELRRLIHEIQST